MKHRFQGFPQSQFRLLLIPFALTILAGCQALSGLMPEPQKDSRQIDQIQKAVPPTWSIATPQPLSNAASISQNQLATWFATFNDPLLDRMIKNAQLNSPTVAAAVARIDQARAQTRAANAGGALQINGSAALNRSGGPTVPANTVLSFGADAGWEIDFWGAVSRSKTSADAKLLSTQALLHDAQLILSASIATVYTGLKACEQQLGVQQIDLQSQTKTLELTALKVKAGFSAPADAALLRAQVANSRNQLTSSQAECSQLVNTLASLSGLPSSEIQQQSGQRPGQMPKPSVFAVQTLPADLLVRRPDIVAMEKSLAAAWEQIGIAQANQKPRLRISGNLALGMGRAAGQTYEGINWGFGPSLSLPLFDGGQRQAAVDASRSRFEEVLALTRLKLQDAITETQEAMILLESAQSREANAQRAVVDFEAFFRAAETRWQVGVGSLLELEEARRLAAGAKVALVRLEQDRLTQTIALYKALGGGWDKTQLDAFQPAQTNIKNP